MMIVVAAFFSLGVLITSPNTPAATNFDNTEDTFFYELAVASVYDGAIETAEEVKRTGARSAIVAHHLLVADKIVQTIATLGNGREQTIVLLSPNHFDFGRSPMQITDGVWETDYGSMEVDTQSLDALMNYVELSDEPETFHREHGISAVVPFIRNEFQNAKLLPVIIHESATQEEVIGLAQGIVETVPDAIVIASIDMSHNLPEYVRIPHDEETLATIAAGTCSGECNLEIDANAALGVLFEINRLRGEQTWNQTHHGSSLEMGATNNWRENTSHILGYFEEGEPEDEGLVSMQFVGDVMLDRGLRTWMYQNTTAYPWEEVIRFLMGADLVIGNLEGTVSEAASIATEEPPFRFTFSIEAMEELLKHLDVVSLANNHTRDRDFDGELETQGHLNTLGLEWFGGYATTEPVYRHKNISLVGFHEFGTDVERALETIRTEKALGQFVIVLPHWGWEYIPEPQDGQHELSQHVVDAGADFIIGAHPHVIQGIEIVDDTPVVYSLGNFIFDSFEPGTEHGLSVTLHFSEGAGMMYLMPLNTEFGQPTPLSDEEAENIFIDIASYSSEELAPHILTGMIPFTYE
jgi:AmmeMemoRadiSam system protein B